VRAMELAFEWQVSMIIGGPMPDSNSPRATNIFSDRGEWIAFIHRDNTVWRPSGFFVGYLDDGDLFEPNGGYIGSVAQNGTLYYIVERSARSASCVGTSPPAFPGYPGAPAPSLIAPSPKLVDRAGFPGTSF
jgi:hypothetical protein